MSDPFKIDMPEEPEAERLEKLPVWAKEYIGQLKRAASDFKDAYRAHQDAQEPTRIIAGDAMRNPFYFPDSTHNLVTLDLSSPDHYATRGDEEKKYRPEAEISLQVRKKAFLKSTDQERLWVEMNSSHGAIVVRSQASNVIWVSSDR